MTKLLIEIYREHRLKAHAELAQQRQHIPYVAVAHKASQALFEVSQQTLQKIMFAQSACQMLYDLMGKLNPFLQRMKPFAMQEMSNVWIEFSEPFTAYDISIQAMIFVKLYDMTTIAKVNQRFAMNLEEALKDVDHLWALDCIDSQGDPVFNLIYNEQQQQWQFSDFHECPLGQCQWVDKTLIPCVNCQSLKAYWSQVLPVSLMLKDQFFAQEKTEQYTALRRVPRKENPKKHRTINVAHVFRVIDASTKTIREMQETMFPRGSWLARHDDNEIVYIDQTVKRTYRHERYKNVRGTTQEVVQHRPVLKDNMAKQVTKVVASEYEDKH